MSNKIKISEMPTASTLKNEDYIPIVQDGINKKIKKESFDTGLKDTNSKIDLINTKIDSINTELEKFKKALFLK